MKSYNIQSKKKQQGFTLIEMAIVLVLAAAVVYGIFAAMKVVGTRTTNNQEVKNATMIAADLKTKFGGQLSYSGLTNSTAIQINAIPKGMIQGANIVTGWGTTLAITASNVNGTANDGFALTYEVPADSCSDFISAVEGAFTKITIGTNVVKNARSGDSTLTVADLARCSATATGNAGVAVILEASR